jgi:hypothetical protein
MQLGSRSPLSTIKNVNLVNAVASDDDLRAETSLVGAYKQLQGSTRIYLSTGSNDVYWLKQSVPSTISASNFSWNTSDPYGALQALPTNHGRYQPGHGSQSRQPVCNARLYAA